MSRSLIRHQFPAVRPIVQDRLGAARRFAKATQGATAVEFALVAPFLLATILFLISIGYVLFLGQSLDYATQKAARQIRTGQIQTAGLTRDQFRTQIICPTLPSMFNCDDVIVNVQAVPTNGLNHPNEYYNFVSSDQKSLIVPPLSNTQTSYCPNVQKGYVYLQVLYPSQVFLNIFTQAGVTTTYNGQQRFLLMATATFLNEPFGSAGVAC